MRVSHSYPAISAKFDDPNLVSCAGLAPTMALAHRAGLGELVADTLTLKAKGGVNAHLKVPALVAGMVAGADSINDMDVLRHSGMNRLFNGIRSPSTLGTFLRSFTFGHVRQLDAVAARFLVGLAKNAPILPGAGQGCYVDIDDTIKATYGYQKQGAGYGYTGVKGLNALLAIVSTPLSAPMIAATRLRRGGTNSARGAARIVSDALATAKACGAGGLVTVRADSAYYTHDVIAAARRGGARFSVTVRMNPAVIKAISEIGEAAWTPIRYPNAIWDEGEQRFISDAEVAEVPFTAFTSRRKADHITARLIVRRVKRLNPKSVPDGQGELFSAYRHHGLFTDSPLVMLQAEKGPPRPRDRRAGHRRPQERRPGPFALRPVCVQQRMAGHGRDGFQPHPCRRCPRVGLPRQGHHRDHPPAADLRPRQTRDLRAATDPAPTQGLALVGQLGRVVQRGLRTTNPSNDLTTHPQQGQPHTQVEEPDRPAASTRPPAYSDSESVSTAREYFSGGSTLMRGRRSGCRGA